MSTYWDDYYEKDISDDGPSQFAMFVSWQFSGFENIVDIGCGNGRDSFFFASNGLNVLGIDSSKSAIDLCNRIKVTRGLTNPLFLKKEAGEDNIIGLMEAGLADVGVIYFARFFLHSITEEAELRFLHECARKINDFSILAVEFRTEKDEFLQKSTPYHFRRFLHTGRLKMFCQEMGFHILYEAEGQEMAKKGEDNAVVGRLVMSMKND